MMDLLPTCPPIRGWRRFFKDRHMWNRPWGVIECVRCGKEAYVEYGR